MPHHDDRSDSVRWPTWADWLVFLVLAVVIAASNWPAIGANNIELGDFAANSLLIQDAKSLKLIYGNYSRVGFNHPGPAFLYVLAAGEGVFYDLLHVVRSPLSGQLLAVVLLGAAWLTALMRVIRRSLQSAPGALLFTGVFMLALAQFDPDILAGLWFPHLYVLPFAVFVASAATLVHGRTHSILPLAVSTGFLVNGHVSFVAIAAIVLACVLLANLVLHWNDPACRVLGGAFLRAQRRAVLTYIGIVLAFLVPFLIANLVDTPAPVRQYLAFSHGNKGNTLRQAATYVGVYWQGILGAIAVAGLVLVVAARHRLAPAGAAAAGALLTSMAAASLGLLYYAKVGIDMLEFNYIGLYYIAVPGFAVALAAWCVQALVAPLRRHGAVAILAGLVAVGVAYAKMARPPQYASQFNQPGIVGLFTAVSALHPGGRIVLDVDNGANWGSNWVHILGMQAYAKRRHVDPFCVNANWHISFTKAARCTPAELATAPRYFVHESSTAPASLGRPAVDQLNVAFFASARPAPVGRGRLTVKEHARDFTGFFLQSGWSTIEGDFVWSLGQQSSMAFAVPAGFQGSLAIDAQGFLPRAGYVQQVEVLVDGKLVQIVRFTNADNRKRVVVPVAAGASGVLTIDLRYPNAISPEKAGLSPDPRTLAMGLFGIELKRN